MNHALKRVGVRKWTVHQGSGAGYAPDFVFLSLFLLALCATLLSSGSSMVTVPLPREKMRYR
jgi:hypothetical protein